MSVKTYELLWQTVAYRKAGYDAVVQLWRYGDTGRLTLSSTEGVIMLTEDERRVLGALLLEGLEDKPCR